jgi:hypothetical protein
VTEPEDLSSAQFQPSDLDRLADYAAGVLDRVDAAEVSRLIATQASWADAYLGLIAADAMTKAELRADARARLEPMPSEVIARLEAAFRQIDAGRPAQAPAAVVPLEPARRRRRLSALVAAAAAVVAIAGGVTVAAGLIGTSSQLTSGEGSRADSNAGAGGAAAVPAPALGGQPLVMASGTDYGPGTLGQVGRAAAVPGAGIAEPTPSGAKSSRNAESFFDLATGDSLQVCLAAIIREHPGTVTIVDYARYLGQPALVVLIRTDSGGGIAVAVGPACGRTGADERASAPVP